MRVISVLCLTFLPVVFAKSVVLESPLLSYHDSVGIPGAKRIKEVEDLSRIAGGAVAPTHAHPYLAGLVISMIHTATPSVCGSSLVSRDRLVTAAHCWFDGSRQAWLFEVVLGSQYLFHGGTRVPTSDVIAHPQFNPRTYENDVAMIYLMINVEFTHDVQPIAIPTERQLSETFLGKWATAAGYGRINDLLSVAGDSQVSQVVLNIVPTATCRMSYGSQFVSSGTLCTSGVGGVGICSGDSGGPLVLNHHGQLILVGISSFGAERGCQLGHPSAFVRVTSFHDFIMQHIVINK